MKLQMKEWKVVRFSFNVKEKEKISKENCEFSFGSAFPDSTPKEFVIGFLLKIIEESYDCDLLIKKLISRRNKRRERENKEIEYSLPIPVVDVKRLMKNSKSQTL